MSEFAITVIIPVFNAENTISKCLDSILNQTFTDYEVIAINDGSKDQSIECLRMYESRFSNISVFDQENQGASLARNFGISRASGKYLVFIDSDDYIDKDYLETYYRTIEETGSDIVIGGIRRLDKDGKVVDEIMLKNDEWSKYIITSPCTRIFRHSFLLENELFFINYTMEDIHFNAVAFSKTSSIVTINYIGYNNVINHASTTQTLHKGIREDNDIFYILSEIHKVVPSSEMIKFFYMKNYIYYLLVTGRHSSSYLFIDEYIKIKQWLVQNDLVFKSSPFNRNYRSERFKTKLVIQCFIILEKMNLIPIFAKMYCINRS